VKLISAANMEVKNRRIRIGVSIRSASGIFEQ
jgi:hypothetical protein